MLTRMAHESGIKTPMAVGLDSGAIVAAKIHHADQGDTSSLQKEAVGKRAAFVERSFEYCLDRCAGMGRAWLRGDANVENHCPIHVYGLSKKPGWSRRRITPNGSCDLPCSCAKPVSALPKRTEAGGMERIHSLRQTSRLRGKRIIPVLVDAMVAFFNNSSPEFAWIRTANN
jgi:hypothetical protein